jgi:cold shock CspA family protein
MEAGVIDVWVAEKGYGFIRPRTGGNNVFLHISDIVNAPKDDVPQPGDVVLFDVIVDEGQERPKARQAILIMAGDDDSKG